MKIISTSRAPEALGPYSQAVQADAMVFCSGQLGINPETKKLADGIEAQSEQALSNIAAVLKETGCSLSDVVKTTVFLSDMNNFPVLNNVYAKWFGMHKPARSTIQVAALPLNGMVEIECIAIKS
jgi:2-iminobutanoate/2-iminopropanoate deaminase